MTEEYKYICNSCEYFTNYKSKWEQHAKTELHITGKRKIRVDKKCIEQCPNCEYTSKGNTNMKQHILNEHKTKEERQKEFKYYCIYCDYGTFAKTLEDKHNNTPKHKHILEIINNKVNQIKD